jgi:hypothetical protein
MGVMGSQFGRLSGILARLAGRFMARNNARDEELRDILIAAGLRPMPVRVLGTEDRPSGRPALAHRSD